MAQVSDKETLGKDTDVAAMGYAPWIQVVLATGEGADLEDTRDKFHTAQDSARDEMGAAAAAAEVVADVASQLARQHRCCSGLIEDPS